MYNALEKTLTKLNDQHAHTALQTGLKGLEKESLRVTSHGHIADTPHPVELGSALTHPHLTTDYSEALLELITPPFVSIRETLSFLTDLHHFIYEHIDEELLWSASMPCLLESDESIPIANYGTSNVGRMKHVYRHGLAHRYGRAMQAIAGVHFNYSISEKFWPIYQSVCQDDGPEQAFIDRAYMSMIRNFQRIGWLTSYLFGASPAVCKSFVRLRSREFNELDSRTCYEPYSTSLRMSDIGYKNKSQDGIDVSYNSLAEYVQSLRQAISLPCEEYEAIGVKVDGEYRQLNTNLLQIENEYYSFVRPKQVAASGETPTHALHDRGIRYVEIRSLDVNPYDPTGVNETELRFMEALLIFCLLTESRPMQQEERHEFMRNQSKAACCGLTPGLKLQRFGEDVSIKAWASEILENMQGICALLDKDTGETYYTDALLQQQRKLDDPDQLPSAQIMHEMRTTKTPFFKFALEQSVRHKAYFSTRKIPTARFQQLEELAAQSLNEQKVLEDMPQQPFDEFLRDYFEKAAKF